MPFDTITMCATLAECAPLRAGRVTKIYQPDRFSVLLRCYTAVGNLKLLLSAHPVDGRLQLSERTYANPAKPPLFCMVLRKHLEGAKITAFRQPPGERVAEIDFAARNEIGEATNRRLVLEVMGKHSNLILLDPDTNLIIDAARRYTHNVSRYREVLPGSVYLPPPRNDKPYWQDLNEEEFALRLLNGDLTLAPAKLLQNEFSGLSPYLCREVTIRAGIEDTTAEELGEYEISRLYAALKQLGEIAANENFCPVLLGKEPDWRDYYALPPSNGAPHTEFPSMSKALDAFFGARQERQEFDAAKKRLQKLLTREQQRLRKKIKLEQADYANASQAEQYKNAGDLLSAYLYLVQPGQTEIELPDFYQPERMLKIKLAPELSPSENVKRYFHHYNKAKNTERQIRLQLEANCNELDYVESLLIALDETAKLSELTSIEQEMQAAGYLKRPEGRSKPKDGANSLEPKRYQTSDGFLVLLGRNNRQNDRLTCKLAEKNDLWFHTQKIPGSHVILRAEAGREFSDQAIGEAAALAARHSRAKEADKVPVDYTAAANVKKPNGAKPGMVIYTGQQTVYVTPQELTHAE